MKHQSLTSLALLAIICGVAPLSTGTLFLEDFETPDVSALPGLQNGTNTLITFSSIR